jgi:glucosamine 6-phosphate synthetase-like amidotransferase/phosphosugar isomerase protein
MCGIVGLASGFTNGFSVKEADVFMDMLYIDAMRGMDSTGVFGVDKHGNVGIHKEASQAGVFMKSNESRSFRSQLVSKGLFAVGHNRAATRGSIKDENAHPFWVDDKIVLVQNGTYKGSHKHHKDVEVDTEAIAHVLADEPDVEKALKTVNAAYALVWYNTETKQLNLLRNDERPLWLAKLKGGGLVWCSEPGFMYLAASRNSLEFSEPPKELDPYTLVSLTLDNNHWKKEERKVDCKYSFPVQEQAFPMVPVWYNAYKENKEYGSRHRFRHDVDDVDQERVDTLLSEILLGKYTETHMTSAEVYNIRNKVLTYHEANKERTYPIEVLEYEPANAHPQCTSWHVWGNFVADMEVFDTRVVAHWFLKGMSETEAMEYISQEFYTAKIASVRMHTQNDHTSVVTCFMHSVTAMETLSAEVN